jgi:holo-[acyl-carrier protein] synthase
MKELKTVIKGIGIDITEIQRIQEMIQKHPRFAQKILTPAEDAQYRKFGGSRATEYLAGRWSLKESFSKAYGTGIGSAVGFQDIEIIDNQLGAPIVTKSPFKGRVHASVSHTAVNVMTEIILESENKND